MRTVAWLSCLGMGLAAGLSAGPAVAAIVEVGPGDDVEGAINAAQPGDEIVLAGGMYMLTERFSFDIAGTEGQPIIIRAAEGEQPHLHRPNAAQNIIDIDGATWVEIRGIEFSGGSAGIRISAANNLTIADCQIHDTGDVAVRANDSGVLYESVHILRNEIYNTNDTGEGMYLGCNNDGCRMANAVIERNYIHDTNQASVSQGDGIELKEGSYGCIIRDNVIHDTNYPCILTYSAVGNGPANIIERNVMWNCGDNGIQSAADTVIRNNIILSANGNGIAMQQHQAGAPQNLMVVHNTIFNVDYDAIALRDQVGEVTIANNAVFAQSGSAIFVGGGDNTGLTMAGNIGAGGVSGGGGGGYADGNIMADFIDGHYGGAPPIDVFPAIGSALVGAGDPAYVPADDFNTIARNGEPDVGAYAYDPAGNPGWVLAAEFKEFPDDGGGTTGGGDTGDTGDDTEGDGSLSAGSGDEAADDTGDAMGGSGGTGGTGAGDASAGADGGGGEEGGCGCRSSGGKGGPLGLALVMLLAAVRRRSCIAMGRW